MFPLPEEIIKTRKKSLRLKETIQRPASNRSNTNSERWKEKPKRKVKIKITKQKTKITRYTFYLPLYIYIV